MPTTLDIPPGSDPRILILGAGPTGLGAAWRLRELGHAAALCVERSPHVGGLAHSVTDAAGFTWDIGGHVMFSHYDYYDRVFESVMREDFTLNDRESWIRILDRWVPYPFQNNVRCLPPAEALECVFGLVEAQTAAGRTDAIADAANFAEFIDAVFGEGIVRLFMRPYNFKVWAHPPELLGKAWIGERVAVIDWKRALRNIVLGQDDYGWGPNNRFKYPLRGGTGEFYRRMGEVIGRVEDGGMIATGRGVASVDVDRRVARLMDGTPIAFDALISAAPLDLLVGDMLTGHVPAEVREAAARLRHSAGLFVGVGIRRPCPSRKCWMYFPEDNCPFYRVTYLSNYSPYMTPDGSRHYSLLCETSHSAFKPVDEAGIAEATIVGLERAGLLEPGERDDIVSVWTHRVEHSYPTPTVDRDEILSIVIPWLESRGIYSRGRFGMWKYEVSNTDHTLMQGVEVVNRLLHGEPEVTIGLRYESTSDGRRAARHERAGVAGSGEKRAKIIVPPGGAPAKR